MTADVTGHGNSVHIVLYDDGRARQFEPFATTRPHGEVRSGALLVRERWERALGRERVTAFAGGHWLQHFSEFDSPPALAQQAALANGTLVVNSRALPSLSACEAISSWFQQAMRSSSSCALRMDSRVAAVFTATTVSTAHLVDGSTSLDDLAADLPASRVTDVPGLWIEEVWDHIALLTALLNDDIPVLASELNCEAIGAENLRSAFVTGAHSVWIESGATIEPWVVFDASAGPVLVRAGAVVQSFTRIIGPCYVGANSTVMADRIANCSIGNVCRVHGEVSSTIFIGHANKGHDGFVGHSIIGRWVNLGAGTITSNLKNTYGAVALWTPDGVRSTGLQFVGTMFGDHVKTGIGLRLTTGCVLGAGANVFDAMPPKMVPPFTWGTTGAYTIFDADKFVEIAERMMQRRHVSVTESQRAFLKQVHGHVLADGRWGKR